MKMNREDTGEFWKTGLHRKITVGEELEWELRLTDRPEAMVKFEDEVNLNRALRQLPDAPVSSNFTALVMQAIEREHRHRSHSMSFEEWRHRVSLHWVRKLAFASMLVLLGFLSYQQYQISARRELADSIVQISEMLPSEGMIADLRAIEGFGRVSLTRSGPTDLLDALR